ncbi:hypothetical protein CU048_07865 [Beijerinckiaceae bacterium]|nr:hypothetical protein CU048_07865 [Beijerinckiaceae bacterium]
MLSQAHLRAPSPAPTPALCGFALITNIKAFAGSCLERSPKKATGFPKKDPPQLVDFERFLFDLMCKWSNFASAEVKLAGVFPFLPILR